VRIPGMKAIPHGPAAGPAGRLARAVTSTVTSVVMPLAAAAHRIRGEWRHRTAHPRGDTAAERLPAAVLFDRDGTLVRDMPGNGDPDQVAPVRGAHAAVDQVRRAGVPVAVVANQPGAARRLISREDVNRVNEAVEKLLGPFGAWAVCPHAEADCRRCRQPGPGLIEQAATQLGVPAQRCVVIGDIAADVRAAEAAGARGILVPTWRTRPEEVASCAASRKIASDLAGAVEAALSGGHRD
jgi:histidinol-phosphate phosphatase family protein